ncbi:unnamed protein product [Ranitomeya imitator]|uniref:Hematopoietic cell-specific Lyn substrate 1 n=1 Tax=Ranitomeya imitator TaxID=111125 RepID=A0ABN9KRA3_9NEOB|nr:unnamed protein product [Ranitomeya imitator]
MWKAAVGHNVAVTDAAGGDDWETDPDFVNDITEEEQRWGAKTIQGSGRPQHIDIKELRSNVSKEHEQLKKKEFQQGPKASYGYGGQFGTEKDRMDKSALGHEYKADVGQHSSQTDAAKGFGGKYGVQKERCDKVSKYILNIIRYFCNLHTPVLVLSIPILQVSGIGRYLLYRNSDTEIRYFCDIGNRYRSVRPWEPSRIPSDICVPLTCIGIGYRYRRDPIFCRYRPIPSDTNTLKYRKVLLNTIHHNCKPGA